MAPDPNTLEHVFNLLGHFAFDRVKELCVSAVFLLHVNGFNPTAKMDHRVL